jgi:hypothetical protein
VSASRGHEHHSFFFFFPPVSLHVEMLQKALRGCSKLLRATASLHKKRHTASAVPIALCSANFPSAEQGIAFFLVVYVFRVSCIKAERVRASWHVYPDHYIEKNKKTDQRQYKKSSLHTCV